MRKFVLASAMMIFAATLAGCGSKPADSSIKPETPADTAADIYQEGYNIYDLPALPIEEELLETMYENKTLRIERIISTGQVTDGWYDQEEHEYIILVEGSAKLEYEDGEILELNKGDTLLIPAHQKHRVAYTSTEPECNWICIFWKAE